MTRLGKVLFLVAVALTVGGVAFAQEKAPVASVGTQVVVLGTGTPLADPERSGPAVAIVVNETAYLVDCGPGVVRRPPRRMGSRRWPRRI